MKLKYNYEDNNGKEYFCTPLQWKYWNRKAIAEERKKVRGWIDAMFSVRDNIA